MITIESAARLGGSAGLLQEGEPSGFSAWPAAAREAFHEQYARGRRTRLIAEGKATLASPPDLSRFAGMSRAALAQEFADRPELQREFMTVSAFTAYALAAQSGRVKIASGRVVKA